MLQEYTKDPANKWIDKEAAIYIVISLAVKTKTERHGATTSNSFINLSDFYQNQIKVELTNPNCHPIVRSAAIKYIMTFRYDIFVVSSTFVNRYLPHFHDSLQLFQFHIFYLSSFDST